MDYYLIIQVLLMLGMPRMAELLSSYTSRWVSPVVICYLTGILLANVSWFPVHETVAAMTARGAIVLAIPLLLFSTDFSNWQAVFQKMALGFLLVIIASVLAVVIISWLVQHQVENSAILGGLIAAIFTGGIPNMQAVGMAKGVDSELLVLLNGADVLVGGVYLVFLTSVAHWFLGLFLKKLDRKEQIDTQNTADFLFQNQRWSVFDFLKNTGWSVVVVLLSVGICWIFLQKINGSLVLLLLTVISLLFTISKNIQSLKGTYPSGDYFLLIFCVAIGMLAQIGDLLTNGWPVVRFLTMVWGTTVLFHWLLCYFFKIDRDTAMIAGTAAIYGPVFIGQITSTIRNERLAFPGIMLGLLGIGLGNFVGLAMISFLEWLFGY